MLLFFCKKISLSELNPFFLFSIYLSEQELFDPATASYTLLNKM